MGGVCFSDRGPLRVTLLTSWPEGAPTASGLHVPSSLTLSASWDAGVNAPLLIFYKAIKTGLYLWNAYCILGPGLKVCSYFLIYAHDMDTRRVDFFVVLEKSSQFCSFMWLLCSKHWDAVEGQPQPQPGGPRWGRLRWDAVSGEVKEAFLG